MSKTYAPPPPKTAIPNDANHNALKDSIEILFQLFLPDRKNNQKPTQAPLGPTCRNQTTQIKTQFLFIQSDRLNKRVQAFLQLSQAQ